MSPHNAGTSLRYVSLRVTFRSDQHCPCTGCWPSSGVMDVGMQASEPRRCCRGGSGLNEEQSLEGMQADLGLRDLVAAASMKSSPWRECKARPPVYFRMAWLTGPQ